MSRPEDGEFDGRLISWSAKWHWPKPETLGGKNLTLCGVGAYDHTPTSYHADLISRGKVPDCKKCAKIKERNRV